MIKIYVFIILTVQKSEFTNRTSVFILNSEQKKPIEVTIIFIIFGIIMNVFAQF